MMNRGLMDPGLIIGRISVQPAKEYGPEFYYALVNDKGEVMNIIVWDGESPFTPSTNHQLIKSQIANIGDIFDGQIFTKPLPLQATEALSNNPNP